MNQYIIIAACLAVGVLGIVGALWSIHGTHCRIYARDRDMDSVDDAAIQSGTLIVSRIEVLRPSAGDLLVLEIDRPLTGQQREHIRQMIWPHVPEGVKLVVLDAHVSVRHVVKPAVPSA